MDQTVLEVEDRDSPSLTASLYERDLHAWARQQSEALRKGHVSDLDLPNLIDEVGAIARWERRRFRRRLGRLCHQVLLWDYGRLPKTSSRVATIANQRGRVAKLLVRCPSLEDCRTEALAEGYPQGRYGALIEDEALPEAALPACNPYGWDEVMTREIALHDGDGGSR